MTSAGVQVGGRWEMPSGAVAPQTGPALAPFVISSQPSLLGGQEGISHLWHKVSDLHSEHPTSKVRKKFLP